MKTLAVRASLCTLVALASATAFAQEPEPRLRDEVPGAWMLYGVSLGGLLEDDTTYAAVGLEVSYAHVLPSLLAPGLYAELRYDQGAEGASLSFGPQIGYAFFVLDAGPYARFGRHSAIGFRARACVAIVGAVSFCGGAAALSGGERFGEVTLLLKYPRRRSE
ncbi:MAG: hypothetical protein H6721_15310 [Sandaracinus sp.]|nr:hypothetical protein [Sandaracinus sp.]MCB9612353.1 hypothetical protein [Sandaracinus sp.]MCB9633483.1 hypothetical protein [Sandaracinus sp.]